MSRLTLEGSRSRARRVLALAVGLVTAISITGCTRPYSPTVPPLSISSGSPQLDVLPLQRYELTYDEAAVLHDAMRVLRSRCLARFGVVGTDSTMVDPTAFESSNIRRYGITDSHQAATWGYSLPPSGGASDSPVEWNPSEAERLTATGATTTGEPLGLDDIPIDKYGRQLPDGGCAGEAERRLNTRVSSDQGLVVDLQNQAFAASERDSRVQIAWSAWTSCMANRGYSYTSPWEPNDKLWTGRKTEERTTAVADSACRQQTQLLNIWGSVESGYQLQLIEKHRTTLTRLRETRDDTLRRARAISGG